MRIPDESDWRYIMLKEIKIGDRIILFGKLYRILIKHRGLILMIEMNVDKMIFKWEHETVLSLSLIQISHPCSSRVMPITSGLWRRIRLI